MVSFPDLIEHAVRFPALIQYIVSFPNLTEHAVLFPDLIQYIVAFPDLIQHIPDPTQHVPTFFLVTSRSLDLYDT